MGTQNATKESIQKKLSDMRKQYNKLEKLQKKKEEQNIFDTDLDNEIEALYDEIQKLENKLEEM